MAITATHSLTQLICQTHDNSTFQFKTNLDPSYPIHEIDELSAEVFRITTLGLIGALGVLPDPDLELIQSLNASNMPELNQFLDLLFSYYAQLSLQLSKQQYSMDKLRQTHFYQPLLGEEISSLSSLKRLIELVLELPCSIQYASPKRIKLAKAITSTLGRFNHLKVDAVLGSHFQLSHRLVQLYLGPVALSTISAARLAQWQFLLTDILSHVHCDALKVVLQVDQLAPAILSHAQKSRLGFCHLSEKTSSLDQQYKSLEFYRAYTIFQN